MDLNLLAGNITYDTIYDMQKPQHLEYFPRVCREALQGKYHR